MSADSSDAATQPRDSSIDTRGARPFRLGGAWLTILALIYPVVLHQMYVRVIEPTLGYSGFVSTTPWMGGVALALTLVVLPVAWTSPRPLMPRILQRPSDFVVWLLFVLVYVPSVTIPHYHPLTRGWAAVNLSLMLFVAWLALLITLWLPRMRGVRVAVSYATFGKIMSLSAIALLLVIAMILGLPDDLPSLNEEYVTRAEFKTSLEGGGLTRLAAYLVPWTGHVVLPALFAVSVYLRKPSYGVVAGVGIAVLFGLTGFKSMLFAPLLVGSAFIVNWNRAHLGRTMLLGVLAVVLAAWMIDLFLGGILFSTLFPRRLILVPGLLGIFFYDFFSKNPKALFADSRLNPFSEPVYDVPPAFVIGREYFGSVEHSANANVFIDAYANGGFGAMVAIAILLGLVLLLVDSAARGKDRFLSLLLIAMPALDLSNGALPTVIFTHGMGLALLLIMVSPQGPIVQDAADPAVPLRAVAR